MKFKILRKIILNYAIIIAIIGIFSSGCKKFVDVPSPPNKLTDANSFSSNATAQSAVNGIYAQMTTSSGFASGGIFSVTQLAGLSADEFVTYWSGGSTQPFYLNSVNSGNSALGSIWNEPYKYIYSANAILEGVNSSSGLSDSVKQSVIGQAKFIRAFCYFYLTNLFGDVPLYTTSNYQINSVARRSTKSEVFNQIISDLQEAQGLLPADYSLSTGQRYVPNKWAALALLARTYLYENKFDSASAEATLVINNTDLYSLPADLNSVFLANSQEAIWQLLPVTPSINTHEGATFILTTQPFFIALSQYVLASFEPGDLRLSNWVNSYSNGTNTWYYAYKYKVQAGSTVTEYSMVLRLAEQYLIRAEARAQMNDIPGSQSDLNSIRTRAGLPNTTADNKDSLLLAIDHERQVELFSEWGHRWLDLKRRNRADDLLGAQKPGWQPIDTLYPIPSSEILNNSNIIQNAGY